MPSTPKKSSLVPTLLLWCGLFFIPLVNAQDDPCEIYGEGYVCENDTRRLHMRSSSVFEDPLTCNQNLYENVMKLLEDGQKILEEEFALNDSDEAVMMIGNTGTGKSTLTYFLAGDNSKMFSYQVETDLFLIKDCNGKIGSGDSTIVSATIYPDLVIENSTGTPFYDNPGFQDTRSACIEIANAYFMQQIVHHIKKVKFVIVVNKFEVSSGGSREDFPRTLRNVFNFVPNIEKFGSGLGLVATKLAALNSNDDSYVKDVVSFMNKSQSSFPEIFSNPEELRKANFIVDSILDVSRVAVFRMPSECGPLSEIDLMQKNRANIIKVILENIEYIEADAEDFALSVSAEAQLSVQAVGVELAKKIQNSIQTFSSAIYNYFIFSFDCVQQNNCDDLVEDFKILFSNPDFINDYDAGDFVGLTLVEVVGRITNASFIPPKLVDSLAKGFIDDLVQRAGHLDFMNNLAVLNIDIRSWLQSLKDTKILFRDDVRKLVTEIDQAFVVIFNELSGDFQNALEDNLKALNDGKLVNPTEFESALVGLYESSYNLSQSVEGLDPSSYVTEIIENIDLFRNGFSNNDLLNSKLSTLSNFSLHLDFFTTSFNISFNFNPKSWVDPLISLQTSVFDQIRVEIEKVTSNIGYLFFQFLRLLEDHYSQLRANSEASFHQVLDIAESQFDLLEVFSKSVVEGQLRKDFTANLRNVTDSLNAVFIILGTQGLVNDIACLDNALVVLERVNTGKLGTILAEWILDLRSSVTKIRQHIDNFEITFISNV